MTTETVPTHAFRRNDRVRVRSTRPFVSPTQKAAGYNWNPTMDQTCGREGRVIEIHPDYGIGVHTGNVGLWFYAPEWLTLIDVPDHGEGYGLIPGRSGFDPIPPPHMETVRSRIGLPELDNPDAAVSPQNVETGTGADSCVAEKAHPGPVPNEIVVDVGDEETDAGSKWDAAINGQKMFNSGLSITSDEITKMVNSRFDQLWSDGIRKPMADMAEKIREVDHRHPDLLADFLKSELASRDAQLAAERSHADRLMLAVAHLKEAAGLAWATLHAALGEAKVRNYLEPAILETAVGDIGDLVDAADQMIDPEKT